MTAQCPGGRLAPHDVDEQRRHVGPRHRQALGRLAGQHGAIVLVVEDQLEQALFDRSCPGIELRAAVPLHPIGNIQTDVAAAVKRRQDLEPLEQQHQAAHRKPPVIIGRGMKRLRPRRCDEGNTTRPQNGFDVAGRPRRIACVLEHMTADHQVEWHLAQLGPERLWRAADVENAVDVTALEKVDPDERRAIAEASGDQVAPIAFVAIRNQRARSHLQDPRRTSAQRGTHAIEQKLDLARDARADDA